MPFIFEDNEAGIKMIIKVRSPTMRHVSRTHRVALDWLMDSSGSQDTNQACRHQTPTRRHIDKRKFTRDYLCSEFQFDQLHQNDGEKDARTERRQQDRGKVKADTTMNLAVSVSTSSSTVNSPIVSKSPGILKASCRTDWSSSGKPDARNSNQDAAEFLKMAKRCTLGRS